MKMNGKPVLKNIEAVVNKDIERRYYTKEVYKLADKRLKMPLHLIEKSRDLLQEVAECIAMAKMEDGTAEKNDKK